MLSNAKTVIVLSIVDVQKKLNTLYRDKAYCKECLKSFDSIKYNPFYDRLKTSADDNDKPFLNNSICTCSDTIETLSSLSMLLENCTNESIEPFNEKLTSHQEHKNSLSCKFVNIDGNASNFDTLVASLKL